MKAIRTAITTAGMIMARRTATDGFPATRTTATTMPDRPGHTALLRLMAWLSPAFPVGAFSYSHGLERAVHDGLVGDSASLKDWLGDLLAHGSSWNDTVLAAEAHRRAVDGGDLAEVAELAEALAGSRERHMETMLQGAAFLKAASAWPQAMPSLPAECPYPVAVGAVAGAHGIPLASTLTAYIHAFASNQIQAAIRLSVIGQSEATTTLAALEPSIEDVAARAAQSSLDDLGAASMMAEIAAMQHETQYSRLFRA